MSDIVELPACATKRKYSPIWNYFDKSTTGKAKCKFCTLDISCIDGGTSTIRQHLERKHAEKYVEYLKEKEEYDLERKEISTKQACALKNYILFYINF